MSADSRVRSNAAVAMSADSRVRSFRKKICNMDRQTVFRHATALAAGMFLATVASAQGAADVVFTHGKIYTVDRKHPFAPEPIVATADEFGSALLNPSGRKWWADGTESMKYFAPVKKTIDSGARVAIGSDWPTGAADANPLRMLQVLVTRKNPYEKSADAPLGDRSVWKTASVS